MSSKELYKSRNTKQ